MGGVGGKGEGGRGNPAVVRWNDGVEKAARTEDGQYLEVQQLTHSIKLYYNRLTISSSTTTDLQYKAVQQ